MYSPVSFVSKDNGFLFGFITTYGESYRGIVQVIYKKENESLFYCEQPYSELDLLKCKTKERLLGKFKDISFKVKSKGDWYSKDFYGKVEEVEVVIDDIKFKVKVRKNSILK